MTVPGLSWPDVADRMTADHAEARRLARLLHDEALHLVREEAVLTNAAIEVRPVGSVLPRERGADPLAVRFDVTAATLIFARQPHLSEPVGEKHRSWRIVLSDGGALPTNVRTSLRNEIRKVAALQGRGAPQLPF